MFAKAAASATAVPMYNGTVYFDSYDSKIIQYGYAIDKLAKMKKMLNDLENNLKMNSNKMIIPLVNYILILLEGPIFNVNFRIRKRYILLCEFKRCKTDEIPITRSGSNVGYKVSFPDITEDTDTFILNLYNDELQWRSLKLLKDIIANAVEFYSGKLNLVKIERIKKRPSTALGRAAAFDIQVVSDLIDPQEVFLTLDFAVLIKDRESDTSLTTFRKLENQVLSKFITCIKENVLPPVKKYYQELLKFSYIRNPLKNVQNELPKWEESIHRIYAILFRIMNIQYMVISMTRQLYIPNSSYFNSKLTILQAENVHDYEILLKRLEDICYESDELVMVDLIKSLEYYSESTSNFYVQQSSIVDAFRMNISKAYNKMIDNIDILLEFNKIWNYIQNNNSVISNIEDTDDEKYVMMVDERRAVDRLSSIERKQKLEQEKQRIKQEKLRIRAKTQTDLDSLSQTNLNIKRTLSKRSSGFPSSSTSSSKCTSPSLLSPQMSRTNSKSNSTSTKGSPSLSRGSITEQRNKTTTSRLKSALDKTGKTGARKRSSSLQSSFTPSKPKTLTSPLPSRANSLQVGSSLNQKVVQANVTHLASKRNNILNQNKLENSNKSHSKLKQVVNGTAPLQAPLKANNALENRKVQNKEVPFEEADDLIKSGNSMQSNSGLPTSVEKKLLQQNSENTKAKIKEEKKEFIEGESLSQTNNTYDSTYDEGEEIQEVTEQLKKVRFIGVAPMTAAENPRPKRQGWYKKPEVLHYPPPAARTIHGIRYYRNQEGLAFKSSLREMNAEETKPDGDASKESTRSRLTSKLLDKLR